MNGGEIALSLIVLSWNTRDLTLDCLDSIFANPPDVPWELIVIDNASSDDSAQAITNRFGSEPNIRIVVNTENLGFTGGNNQGIDMAFGNVIGLLNSDTIVPAGSMTQLYEFLTGNEDFGVVGPTLTHADGSPTTSFGYFPNPVSIFLNSLLPGWMWGKQRKALGVVPDDTITEPIEVDYVSGASFFVKREVIQKIGAFDSDTFFAYYEETDWCLRIKKAGWKVMFHPGVKIIHLEGKSFEKLSVHRRVLLYDSAKKFYRKHYPLPMLWWYQFCTVTGALIKVVYFGLRMLIQPSKRERLLPHYKWNAFVFELLRRGLGLHREAGG